MGKPTIRFEGYTDDWEQRKLGEVCEIKDSARIPNSEWSETGVPYIRASDVTNENTDGVLFISQERYEFYKNRTGVPTKDDVLFNGGGEIGKSLLITDKKPIYVQGGAVLYARTSKSRELVGQYLKTYFETTNAKSYVDTASAGGTMRHFTLKPSQMMRILMPSVEEQEKIGEYFANLDHLITLHQRKCDEAKKLKKCMLQKMFPKDGEKVPEIRFSGFTSDWKQRKLEEIVNRITRKNSKLISELPLTISAQQGLIDQNEFFDKRVASKDVSGYYLIKNGEFAYNKSTSNDAPWGAIKRLDRYENGVLSTLYIVFEIKDETLVNSDFLVAYYSTNLWHKGIHEIAAEGARNHGLLNIAPTDFFKTKLKLPADIEEQKEIGEYFKKIDLLITFHQQKCDELKNIKRFMLQNIFVSEK